MATSDAGFSLLILGLPGGIWYLELTHSAWHRLQPHPTEDDLLMLYLGAPTSETTLNHLTACGGVQVAALNPYWDDWGVTLTDPDGWCCASATGRSERRPSNREPGKTTFGPHAVS